MKQLTSQIIRRFESVTQWGSSMKATRVERSWRILKSESSSVRATNEATYSRYNSDEEL